MAKTNTKHSTTRAAAQDLQKWVCERVAKVLDLPWGKDTTIASRESGQSGTDVRLVGEAQTRFPFSVECKNQKTWNMQQAIFQAKANCQPNTDWLLVMKRRSAKKEDRIPPVVVLDATVFFRLMEIVCKNWKRYHD